MERHTEHWSNLYSVWKNMNDRCFNDSNSAYHRYGGRGIEVCDKWRYDFIAFYLDAFESYEEYIKDYIERPTIDRINNDKGYYPNNCRWADKNEQYWNSSGSSAHPDINQRPKIIRYPFQDYSLEDRNKFSRWILSDTRKNLR